MNRFAEDLINALREALAHAKDVDNCIEHRMGNASTQTDAATFFAARGEDADSQSAIAVLQSTPDVEPDRGTGSHDQATAAHSVNYAAAQSRESAIRRLLPS